MDYAFLYFFLCMLQPICLPIPEVATVTFGANTLGPALGTLLGITGSLLGISIMYGMAKKGGDAVIKKFATKGKLDLYQRYVKQHADLITGVLFVIPVLPDEIVCIGAAVTGLPYQRMLIVATLFKTISITMISYSSKFSLYLGWNKYGFLAIEIGVVFLLVFLLRRLEQRFVTD